MAGTLDGLHAVVTGGGSGIGAAIAEALAAEGASLTLMGRRLDRVAAHAATLPAARALACDVTDEAAVEAGFAEAAALGGPIAILINNAGAAESAPFQRTTLAQFRRLIDVNLTGAFLCSRAALGPMLAGGFGRIVNIASTAGLRGYPYVAAYCAAKHGLVGLTRALAQELARERVTVNAVCPGYTDTDLVRDAVDRIVAKTGRSREATIAELAKANPQGRLVQPREVAAIVAFLCRRDNEAITGQAIAVAGGEVTG
jgi:NAD(P)-dependent dehydrogenase (short-subunit alcohol dehydrogenase family)